MIKLIHFLRLVIAVKPFLTILGTNQRATKQIENIFEGLVKRAGIENYGVMAWHSGRKLFLRRATELGVSPWSAKLMCGKSVPASDDVYIHNVELKNDFLKISEVLRLFRAHACS
jgi:hypothetical protein